MHATNLSGLIANPESISLENSDSQGKRKIACSELVQSAQCYGSLPKHSTVTPPVFMEACCGCARLSFELKSKGFSVLPVDWIHNKHKAKLPVIKIDLSSPKQVDILISLVKQDAVNIIWAAVPCGTASRAREIPLSDGSRGPRQLRSSAYPRGLPNLSESERQRVEKANDIYDSVATLLETAVQVGVGIVVENPRGSYLWEFQWYKQLLDRVGFFDTDFQHCKWSPETASRPKWTRLRSNIPELGQLAGPCELKHEHLGWGQTVLGQFVTAGEAEYPGGMVAAVADSLCAYLNNRGFVLSSQVPNPSMVNSEPHKRRRAVAAKQPRGNKLPPLLPEFKEVIEMKLSEAKIQKVKILRVCVGHSSTLKTKGEAEQLAGMDLGENNLEIEEDQLPIYSKVPSAENLAELSEDTMVAVGVYRTPEEFVEIAKHTKHPLDLDGAVPDELVEAATNVLSSPPEEAIRFMLNASRELIKLAQDCKEEDAAILEQMHPKLAAIMAKKKLVTLRKLAAKIKHRDTSIVDDIISGFDLVGLAPFCDSFDFDIRLPECSIQELEEITPNNNEAILERCRSTGDPRIDAELWEQTMEECSRGWLMGPFSSLKEATDFLGRPPHLCRRFALQQPNKIRAIDDLSENSVNKAHGYQDKLSLHDVDTLSSLIRYLERMYRDSHGSFVLRDSSTTEYKVHSGWKCDAGWLGKTFDLKAAYKQLCVSPQQWNFSAVVVFNVDTQSPSIFYQVTLPFGATSAVLHFNRVARLLWRIGTSLFRILWCNFYDDYPCVCPAQLQKSTQAAVTLLFKVLGFEFAEEKDRPFEDVFSALGMTFDVGRIPGGTSYVMNKAERVKLVTTWIAEIMTSGSFNQALADKLRGKVQFMEQAIFGRAGKSIIRLYDRSSRGHHLTDRDISDLRWLSSWLGKASPRCLSPMWHLPPVLLFCDGACEFDGADKPLVTCGAVLVDLAASEVFYFGIVINDKLADEWRSEGKRQLVTEAELLPVLLARVIWGKRLYRAKVINFIDSNPALFSCIKGSSLSDNCSNIVRAISFREADQEVWTWYARVPTLSNCADDPSRLVDLPKIWCGYPTTKVFPEQPTSLRDGIWR